MFFNNLAFFARFGFF